MHALPRAGGGRLPDATLAAAGAPSVHSSAPATVGIHTQPDPDEALYCVPRQVLRL